MKTRSARAERKKSSAARAAGLNFIGDHRAIDFVNTLRMAGTRVTDTLETDQDVASWLYDAGVRRSPKPPRWPSGTLLRKARLLRTIAREAIEARKEGRQYSLEALNNFLELAASHCLLVARSRPKIELQRIYREDTPEQYLAPVAESVAELLASGNFDLIRRCEGSYCILWFYDRTKSHRRRWCSAATCGNRAKVAAFRARARQ